MTQRKVTIEGSARHVHVTREVLGQLFGTGFELEAEKYLSQPGEFASNCRVDIVGPKGIIKRVRILGPCRAKNQVELSFTDARVAGIKCPIRESGDIEGSAPCTIIGPAGSVDLKEGVIIAKRHVHFTPEDAEAMGIRDKDILRVQVGGERGLIFDQVVARVSSKFATFMHLDFDEINAAALFNDMTGIIL